MADLPNGAADPGGAPPPPAPASNGADHGADKTYTVTDARSAGDAIAGLLFGADDAPTPPAPAGDKPSGADEAPDTGADESRPTGPDDDKGSGEQPQAAIEPPTSWSSDEKQAFSQLPPALQQTVARRESQREAVLTQRSQEAAEARRAYDGERQAAVAQRSEYLAGLQKMMVLAAPEAQALNNIDWVAVQAQSPAEYTRLHAMREALKSRLGAIEQEFQQGQQQLQQYQQQQLAEVVAKEHQALNEKMPDFSDTVKGNQLRKDLGTYLRDAGGFTPQEINTAYDHRLVVMATKAMLYDKQLANTASADAKRNNVRPGPTSWHQPGQRSRAADPPYPPGQSLRPHEQRARRRFARRNPLIHPIAPGTILRRSLWLS
jgi:hypothetical protein